jgi:hypothetical protein
VPDTRGRGILKERRIKGKSQRVVLVAASQRHAHTAVFWHEGPPEGHSSPGIHIASLSPQFTEQPPQLPRGWEGAALQELTSPLRLAPGGAPAAEVGGPLSLDGEPGEPFSLVTQAASERARNTPAANDAPETARQETVLTSPC